MSSPILTSPRSPRSHVGRARRLARASCVATCLAATGLLAAACGTTASTTSASNPPAGFKPGVLTRKYAGETITVLGPPWTAMPKSQLAKFTAATGIKVDLTTIAWDSIHPKIVSSEAAGVAPADITNIDWSWVGQFAKTDWYIPLNKWEPKSLIAGSPVSPIFNVDGKQLGIPYYIDFRGMLVNMTDLHKAGIATPPTTWAQLESDAELLKAKGIVQYPIGVPLSVTEGASTPWYLLTLNAGGSVLTANDQPAFSGSTSNPGEKALAFEVSLYKKGLIPPGEVDLTDTQTTDLFEAGKVAFVLSEGPGGLAGFKNPSVSKVAKDDLRFVPDPTAKPGMTAKTFGLPGSWAITKQATNKPACALFIYWWDQLPQEIVQYENPNLGSLPPESSGLSYLAKKGLLVDSSDVLAMLPKVGSLFSTGAPEWYPQFSTDLASEIQAAAEGTVSPEAAMSTLAAKTRALAAAANAA